MVVNCSIPDCENNSRNKRLFTIPLPSENNYNIGIKWIYSIIHSYPYFSLDNIDHIYVCSAHFKPQHFIPPDMLLLKSFAIPTKFHLDYAYVNVYSQSTNNTETGINTERGVSANANNNFYTQREDSVKVITVPNQSYNTIETRSTPQNVFNHTPPTEHAQIQEPSEQTATTSSRSSARPKKRKLDYDYCNSIDSEGK